MGDSQHALTHREKEPRAHGGQLDERLHREDGREEVVSVGQHGDEEGGPAIVRCNFILSHITLACSIIPYGTDLP